MSEQSVIARPSGHFYREGNWDIFRSMTMKSLHVTTLKGQ